MSDTPEKKPIKRKYVPETVALHRKPERDAAEVLREQVLGVADEVFDRYVWGESFQAIADTLDFKVAGWKLRAILMEHETTKETYAKIGALRAHNLVDAAIDYGRSAAAIGDAAGFRVAVDTNLKVAAKLNVMDYGDKSKLELTGKNGGAIEVKADLTLTAEQAYERMVKGI
jgi:hypothetical protein